MPIQERDLTGFLRGVWRFNREDQGTNAHAQVPKLMLPVHADRDYIIQLGLETNFSKSFLTGLRELPEGALQEPMKKDSD